MNDLMRQPYSVTFRAAELLLSVAMFTGILSMIEERAIAQIEFCPDPGPIPASEATRSLELPQFGIVLTIPENFRAILRNNGAVEIVNPGTYQVLHCVARGGQALGRGYTSTIVRSVPNPEHTDLRQFVEQNTKLNGNITSYPWHDQQGYLVQSRLNRVAQFWISSNDSEVLVISVGCDCSGGMFSQLLTLLERSSSLE